MGSTGWAEELLIASSHQFIHVWACFSAQHKSMPFTVDLELGLSRSCCYENCFDTVYPDMYACVI